MRVRCSGSDTRDTGVDCLNLYHLDWITPHDAGEFTNRGDAMFSSKRRQMPAGRLRFLQKYAAPLRVSITLAVNAPPSLGAFTNSTSHVASKASGGWTMAMRSSTQGSPLAVNDVAQPDRHAPAPLPSCTTRWY